MSAPLLGWLGGANRMEPPASTDNFGSGSMGRYVVGYFGFVVADGDPEGYTVQLTFTPEDGSEPVVSTISGSSDPMSFYVPDFSGGPLNAGVVEIEVIAPQVSGNKLFYVITGVDGAYGSGSWYAEGASGPQPVPPTKMGWGSVGPQGHPAQAPFLATNAGQNESFFGDDYVYFGVEGGAGGTLVQYAITFTPADGGEIEHSTQTGTGANAEGSVRANVFSPGVTVVRGTAGGIPLGNELFLTVTASSGAYGAIAWHSEGVNPAWWRDLRNAREVA